MKTFGQSHPNTTMARNRLFRIKVLRQHIKAFGKQGKKNNSSHSIFQHGLIFRKIKRKQQEKQCLCKSTSRTASSLLLYNTADRKSSKSQPLKYINHCHIPRHCPHHKTERYTAAGLAPNAYLLANAPTCASQAYKLMPWKQDPHMETHAKAF